MGTTQNLQKIFSILVFSSFVAACSGGGGGGGSPAAPGGEDPNKPTDPDAISTACNHVVTAEAVRKFNLQQKKYRVRVAGMNAFCKFESEENGHKTSVKKEGFTHVEVLPRWQAKDLLEDETRNNLLLRIKIEGESDFSLEQKKEILQGIGVTTDREELPVLIADARRAYSYIRLGRGLILPLSNFTAISTEDKEYWHQVSVSLSSQKSFILQVAKDVREGSLNAEFLSAPSDETFAITSIQFTSKEFSEWQSENTVAVLKRFAALRDRGLGNYAMQTSIQYVYSWPGMKVVDVHAQIPELYSWADRWLRNESLTQENADEFRMYMRYVTAINPEHEKAELSALTGRLAPYVIGSYAAISKADSWIRNRTYTKEQIDFILTTLDQISPLTGHITLDEGIEIARGSNWEKSRRDFLVSVIANFKALEVSFGVTLVTLAKTHVDMGLNPENQVSYWKTWGLLKAYATKNYIGNVRDLLQFADSWSLQSKISSEQIAFWIDLATWIKDKAYLNAQDALGAVHEFVRIAPLTELQIKTLKETFQYLSSSLYYNAKDALKELNELHRVFQLQETPILTMRSLTKYFTDVLYFSNKEGYAKAKNYVQNGVGTPEQFEVLKAHVKWLMDTVYLSKSEALPRTENLVFSKKLSGEQLSLIRKSTNWLMNELYISKGEALPKGESYVVDNKMTEALFSQLVAEYKASYNRNYNTKKALAEAEKKILGRE